MFPSFLLVSLIVVSRGPRPPGPNRSKLQDMLANLRDAEEIPSMQPPVTPPARPAVPRLTEHELGRPEDGKVQPQPYSVFMVHRDPLGGAL